MCFYIDPKNKDIKIAERDITCYKILDYKDNVYKSPYFSLKYDLSKERLFKAKNEKGEEIKILVPLGWESFSPHAIQEGLHSYSNKTEAKANKWVVSSSKIIKFVIPKGSKYYYNEIQKEYVSLELKYKK